MFVALLWGKTFALFPLSAAGPTSLNVRGDDDGDGEEKEFYVLS